MIQIEKPKKEDDTMLPPRKRGRLRSISSRTRSSSSKSQTTKTKSTTGELKATKARTLLKVIDECFKTSPQQLGKSTSESGIQRRNRISSDQVRPS